MVKLGISYFLHLNMLNILVEIKGLFTVRQIKFISHFTKKNDHVFNESDLLCIALIEWYSKICELLEDQISSEFWGKQKWNK